jgi:hypothetical protein
MLDNVGVYIVREYRFAHRTAYSVQSTIRIGLVARICRSHSSKEDQYRQGRGSIPRFGIIVFFFDLVVLSGNLVGFLLDVCVLDRQDDNLATTLRK